MASKALTDVALQLYKSLGGNLSKVLGTRSNVNFLGKGKSSELMVDMDINTEALGVLPKSKAVEELDSAMGYLTSGKLNDMQANKLISNMQKMDEFYNPKQIPNITDMATGTRDLTQEGLGSLRKGGFDDIDPNSEIAASIRLEEKGKKLADSMSDAEIELRGNFPRASDDQIKQMLKTGLNIDDLPPPGSRGGADDIAAPVQSADEVFKNMADAEGVDVAETILPTGAGLEAIKSVKNLGKVGDDIVDNIYDMAGVTKNAQPVARGNARDFLNTIKDMEDPDFPAGTTLSSVMEPSDFKFMTEGGGGIFGDPLLLVQKYFGPKVAGSVAKLEGRDQIELFAKNLVKIKDAKGNSITSRYFDPESINPDDFSFEDGGRVGYFGGARVLGKMGYQALRKYGIEAEDITRLFANLGADKTLRGKEKTMYFHQLNRVLKNPDDFPDGIKEIQLRLGLDPIGFKSGGLAGILEV
mgnify:CR=1 FL=1